MAEADGYATNVPNDKETDFSRAEKKMIENMTKKLTEGPTLDEMGKFLSKLLEEDSFSSKVKGQMKEILRLSDLETHPYEAMLRELGGIQLEQLIASDPEKYKNLDFEGIVQLLVQLPKCKS